MWYFPSENLLFSPTRPYNLQKYQFFFNSPTLNFIDWGGGCYIKLNTHQHGTQALLLKLSGPPQGNTPDFKWCGWSNGGKNQNKKKIPTLKINPKKYHAEFPSGNKFGYTLFAELLCTWLGYVCTTTNPQLVLNTQKNPYLNQATQTKIILATFACPKKNQNQKFQPCVVLS